MNMKKNIKIGFVALAWLLLPCHTMAQQFNDYFGSSLEDHYCETIGGLITDRFEHVPHKGEAIEIEGFRFRVMRGDERQATLFLAEKVVAATGGDRTSEKETQS